MAVQVARAAALAVEVAQVAPAAALAAVAVQVAPVAVPVALVVVLLEVELRPLYLVLDHKVLLTGYTLSVLSVLTQRRVTLTRQYVIPLLPLLFWALL
ncbi:hypothetical protein GS620_11540 [Ruegeria sp. HKCCD6428]|nr:hypothetical protein [Ruegeria sp. HKCCD6428]